MRIGGLLAFVAALAVLASGCAASGDKGARVPEPIRTADASFVVTSTDFVDGGDLPESTKASGLGGQCAGQNISPELSWSGAPHGTAAYAITMIDISADDFVHWTKADILSDVTSVPAGGADALAGVGGRGGLSSGTYFGPCPPTAGHHYVITIYALDAPLGLEANFGIGALDDALAPHLLAEASITGLAGPTG